MAYEAAIFDLDGTILNTLDDLATSVNHALAQHHMPQVSTDAVRRFTGNGIATLVARCVPEGTSEQEVQATLETFKAHYAKHSQDTTGPYPGIIDMLHELDENDVACAVVSNKADFAVQHLVRTCFPSMFGAVVGEQPLIRRKPDPDMVWAAITELGVEDPDNVVYLGDSEVDIETARNTGCDCVLVSWGFRDVPWLERHGAKKIVDTPQELLEAILA